MAEELSEVLPFGLGDLPYEPASPASTNASGMSLPLAAIGGLRGPNSLIWLTPQILQSGVAMLDFGRNYKDMVDAGWIDGDKYFHCKANCQATRRGEYGESAARAISEARELFDEHIKGDPPSAGQADQAANRFGRAAAKSSPAGCDMACSPLRPRGLPLRY